MSNDNYEIILEYTRIFYMRYCTNQLINIWKNILRENNDTAVVSFINQCTNKFVHMYEKFHKGKKDENIAKSLAKISSLIKQFKPDKRLKGYIKDTKNIIRILGSIFLHTGKSADIKIRELDVLKQTENPLSMDVSKYFIQFW